MLDTTHTDGAAAAPTTKRKPPPIPRVTRKMVVELLRPRPWITLDADQVLAWVREGKGVPERWHRFWSAHSDHHHHENPTAVIDTVEALDAAIRAAEIHYARSTIAEASERIGEIAYDLNELADDVVGAIRRLQGLGWLERSGDLAPVFGDLDHLLRAMEKAKVEHAASAASYSIGLVRAICGDIALAPRQSAEAGGATAMVAAE